MNFKEIITLFCWLQDKGCLEEYCSCLMKHPRKLEDISYCEAIKGAFVWGNSPSGHEVWSELDYIWKDKLPDYDPSHPLKISSLAVFRVILGLTDCYAHWDIIKQFEFSFTPCKGIYQISGKPEDCFLWTPAHYNGKVLEELEIPRAYLRKHFPEDCAAHPSTFRDGAICSPEFLNLPNIFEYIKILFEAKEGRRLGVVSPEPTPSPMGLAVDCGSIGVSPFWLKPSIPSDLLPYSYAEAMREVDAIARAAKVEPAREDPLPRINIEPSKHIKL